MNSQEKINRFNELQEKLSIEMNEQQEKSNSEIKEEQELNQLAKEFLEMTKKTYDKVATTYSDVNGTKMPNQFGRDVYSVSVMKDGKLSPDSSGPAYGASSLLNILAGNEKLEYTNYSSSQKYDF